jgi:hypothetical protein
MKLFALIFISIFLFSTVKSADEGDWVDPYKLELDILVHPFYAGYLNVTRSKALYYTYFPSEHNPDKDPLIVRISSLGCSPLYSAYYSKGPFIFVKNTKQLRFNPYNWNK